MRNFVNCGQPRGGGRIRDLEMETYTEPRAGMGGEQVRVIAAVVLLEKTAESRGHGRKLQQMFGAGPTSPPAALWLELASTFQTSTIRAAVPHHDINIRIEHLHFRGLIKLLTVAMSQSIITSMMPVI